MADKKKLWNKALLLFTTLFCYGAIQAYPPPKVKWLYLSGGTILEQWESSGIAWRSADEYPKTINYLNLGGLLSMGPGLGLSLSLPFFYNRTGSFTANQPLYLRTDTVDYELTWMNHKRPVLDAFGLSDLNIGIHLQKGRHKYQLFLWIPAGYDPKEQVFDHHPDYPPNIGFYYDSPWMGFGNYRIGTSLSHTFKQHYFNFSPYLIVFKPKGEKAGMVEPLDFSLPVKYVRPVALSKKVKLKPKIQFGYSRFHWEGKDNDPRISMYMEPGLGISFKPSWKHEVSFSFAFTAMAKTIDHGEDITSKRKLFFSFYYGFYR
ncbi:hypothetical protein ACFL5V_08450 [Fibrobacterota bacterium]